MRLFPMALCFLFALAFGMNPQIGVGPEGKDVKNVKKQELKKEKVKESLVQKHVKDSVGVLIAFPYPDNQAGKKAAGTVVSLLNSAEEVFGEYEQLKKQKESNAITIVVLLDYLETKRDLRALAFSLTLKKSKWVAENKVPEAKYTIRWDGQKWAVVEILPLPEIELGPPPRKIENKK